MANTGDEGWDKGQDRGARRLGVASVVGVIMLLSGTLGVGCSASTHSPPTSSRSSPSTASTSSRTTTSTMSPTSSADTTVAPGTLGSYLPLFPFATLPDVQAWQQSYASGGHQPWHLDAGQTALAFATWLGYGRIDKVVGLRTDGTGAHVSVGFLVGGPNDEKAVSAIVHLVRWGSGTGIPWEVVGTDDTTFSLTRPPYGTTVTSPVTVGGLITGVDENIGVQVRMSSSSSAIGTFCCLAEGNINTPWSVTVSFTASSGQVLTIAAQTGGHVAAVERFTVTGVRVH